MFQAMVASGQGEMDNSGVISVVEMLTGETLAVRQEPEPKQKTQTSKAGENATNSNSPEKQKNTEAQADVNQKPQTSSQPAIIEKPVVEAKKSAPAEAVSSSKASTVKSQVPNAAAPANPAANLPKSNSPTVNLKETPPFIDIDEPVTSAQRERVRVSKNKTTPL